MLCLKFKFIADLKKMFFNLGFPSQGRIRDTVANLGAGSKNLDPHNTMYRYTLPGTDLGFTFEK